MDAVSVPVTPSVTLIINCEPAESQSTSRAVFIGRVEAELFKYSNYKQMLEPQSELSFIRKVSTWAFDQQHLWAVCDPAEEPVSCAHTRVNNCVCVVGFAFWEWPESCLEAAHWEEKRWISGVLFPFRDCSLSRLCNRSWLWFTRIAVLYSLSAVPQLVKSAFVQRTVLFSQTKPSSAWATRKNYFW